MPSDDATHNLYTTEGVTPLAEMDEDLRIEPMQDKGEGSKKGGKKEAPVSVINSDSEGESKPTGDERVSPGLQRLFANARRRPVAFGLLSTGLLLYLYNAFFGIVYGLHGVRDYSFDLTAWAVPGFDYNGYNAAPAPHFDPISALLFAGIVVGFFLLGSRTTSQDE